MKKILITVLIFMCILKAYAFENTPEGFFSNVENFFNQDMAYECLSSQSDVEYERVIFINSSRKPLSELALSKTEMSVYGCKIIFYSYAKNDESYAYFPEKDVTCKIIVSKEHRFKQVFENKFMEEGRINYGKLLALGQLRW